LKSIDRDSGASDEFSEDRLIAILKCSTQWECAIGRNHAIRHLNDLGLASSRWIELGCDYQVSAWLKRGFDVLLDIPLKDLLDEDLDRLGMAALKVVIKAYSLLDYQRRRIALVPPPISTVGGLTCLSHSQCVKVWREVWIRTVGPLILHPLQPLPLSKVINHIRTLSHPGMDSSCKSDALSQLETSGTFQAEVLMKEKVITKIHESYGLQLD
jgi:hypothetical protein